MSDRAATIHETLTYYLNTTRDQQAFYFGSPAKRALAALAEFEAEHTRLTLGCEAALAHAEGLRMDTPEDEAIRLKVVQTLQLALIPAAVLSGGGETMPAEREAEIRAHWRNLDAFKLTDLEPRCSGRVMREDIGDLLDALDAERGRVESLQRELRHNDEDYAANAADSLEAERRAQKAEAQLVSVQTAAEELAEAAKALVESQRPDGTLKAQLVGPLHSALALFASRKQAE